MSKRASVQHQKPAAAPSKAPLPAVLTMGISPAAAVATWRLAESKLFQTYTYWPVQEITFQSEVFGKNQVFQANHFNLNDPPSLPAGQVLAAVILVVPSIKDVARMCKKLKPILSNSTLVLVDICGGLAPLQRLVRTNLGSSLQVSGLISDVDAEFVSKSPDNWQVLHRSGSTVPPAATTASQSLITMEPCQPLLRTVLSLEEAWAAGGLSSTHLKSAAMFAEFQWNRCITTVVFEVLTVVLDSPDPNSIAQSVVAKPLVEGLITEMNMVAAACGCTGLQSKAQMLANGAKLARRAPASFAEPQFSRTYYEVYNHFPVPLDFLVLLPILLSDELPKGGYTPYLECVYAFMSRLLQLNNGEYSSFLLERVGSGSGSSANGGAVNPEVLAALEAREVQIKQREQQLTSFGQARSAEIEQNQQQIRQQQEELQAHRQQLAEEREQHERAKQELVPQHRMQVEKLQAQIQQHQQQLQQQQYQFQQLQQQHQQLQQREIQPAAATANGGSAAGTVDPNVVEGLQNLRLREQELAQREEKLKRDQQIMFQQQQAQQQQHSLNGGATAVAAPVSPPVTAQPPSTPGGTTYSRFDPRAPQAQQPPASVQQQLPQQYQSVDPLDNSFNSIDSRGSRAPSNNGFYASGMSQANSRSQVMMPPPPAANTPYYQANGFQQPQQAPYMSPTPGQYMAPPVAQPVAPQGVPPQFRRRPPSRRASLGDESEIMSVASNTNNRRRQPATQSALFSQNFQLDGVMNSATDRYHFVGRKGKGRDPKLSSDENAYHNARKFIHGGGTSGNYPNLAASGIPEAQRRKSSFQPNGTIAPPTSNGVASNGTAHRPLVNSSSSIKNSVSTPNVPQALIPPTVIPTSQSNNNFGGFNFGGSNESFDDAHHQMPSLDPAARGDGYGSFPGSNNSSSMESNHASDRSGTRTPPTPQGSLDPLKKSNVDTLKEEGDNKGRNWGKRLFKMN